MRHEIANVALTVQIGLFEELDGLLVKRRVAGDKRGFAPNRLHGVLGRHLFVDRLVAGGEHSLAWYARQCGTQQCGRVGLLVVVEGREVGYYGTAYATIDRRCVQVG